MLSVVLFGKRRKSAMIVLMVHDDELLILSVEQIRRVFDDNSRLIFVSSP